MYGIEGHRKVTGHVAYHAEFIYRHSVHVESSTKHNGICKTIKWKNDLEVPDEFTLDRVSAITS